MIERAETVLHELGFRICRVRHHDAIARLEFGRDEIARAIEPSMAEALGLLSPEMIRAARGWSEDDWSDAVHRLRGRGWIGDDGDLTDKGREARAQIEHHTDVLAWSAYRVLDDDATHCWKALVRSATRCSTAVSSRSPTRWASPSPPRTRNSPNVGAPWPL